MNCPICKNKMGFACGRCVECGFNYITGEFEVIKVNVKLLKTLLPQDIVYELIDEHEKAKRQ